MEKSSHKVSQMNITSSFDPQLRDHIDHNASAAVIPVGSIEQHGPHLPVSTDTDIASEIARRVAKRCKFLLLPIVPYGVSFEHAPFFNLSIRSTTLYALLHDLSISLLDNKIKTVFVINGHHGNQKPISNLGNKLQNESNNKLNVFVLSYWHFMNQIFDHAGFVETSLMLAISDNVKMSKAKAGLDTNKMTDMEIKRISKLATRSFIAATGNGIWGDPRSATRQDGQRILSEVVRNISKHCQTCLINNRQ